MAAPLGPDQQAFELADFPLQNGAVEKQQGTEGLGLP